MSSRMLRGVLGMVFAVLVAQTTMVAPAWAQGGEYTDIYVLGQRATTFSPHQPKDLEELKDLFDRYEDDLRVVLGKGGWGGNADDVFTTLRAAKEGDGTVTRRQVQPGESLKWMAYRKNGEPQVIRNPRWSAKKPFDAWQIKVVSNGVEYTFVVPQSCMNLAYDSSKPMAGPTCNLSATYDKTADMVTVKASSNGEIEITSIGVPGGQGSLSDLQSSGTGTWTFKPAKDGTYNFNAKATKGSQSDSCTASVTVQRAKPVCDIDVSVDPETNMITVDASGSAGEFELGGFTLPDGSAGDMAGLQAGTADQWSFDPSATLKRKPGNYTYTFAGSTTLHGFETKCDAAAVIVREAPDNQWIARGYYVHNWPGSDTLHVENPVGVDPPIFTQFWVDGGNGFGGEVEYMARPNLGIMAGIVFSNLKTSLMFDQADVWLTGTDRVDMRAINLGPNYHFMPERRLDLYLGVYASWVNYSSSTFNFQEVDRDYRIEYDNELTFGVNLGLDYAIKEGGPWVITGGLRYTGADLEGDGNVYALSVDPFEGFIGLGYRW